MIRGQADSQNDRIFVKMGVVDPGIADRLMGSLKHNYLVIAGVLSLTTLFSVRYLLLQPPDPYQPIIDWTAVAPVIVDPIPFELDPVLEREMVSNTAKNVLEISTDLAQLLEQKEYGLLRDILLHQAAQAVAEKNKNQLGHVMSLLGQLYIEEQDLDSAEVYLMEALDVYQSLDDSVGAAQVYIQLGRTHLKSRELARTAGDTYDRLLVARWQLSNGQYSAAEQNLRDVVKDSLVVNRYGTAASAYYSLVQLYTRNGNTYEAEQAAMEAARLYAASGQLDRAKATIEPLRAAGTEHWRLYDIEQEIDRSYTEFEVSVHQIERARDYRQLYNHYRAQGDEDRAWKLRLLASKSLKNVSKRAMFHRQPDALALLYVSNDDMGQARDYFDIARQTFDSEGLEGLSTQARKLKEQIR